MCLLTPVLLVSILQGHSLNQTWTWSLQDHLLPSKFTTILSCLLPIYLSIYFRTSEVVTSDMAQNSEAASLQWDDYDHEAHLSFNQQNVSTNYGA